MCIFYSKNACVPQPEVDRFMIILKGLLLAKKSMNYQLEMWKTVFNRFMRNILNTLII